MDYVNALHEAEGYFEGAIIPFVLWGETAKRAVEQKPLDGLQAIEFAVKERSLNKYSRSSIKTLLGENWTQFECQGIPIKVDIIHDDMGLLENPDIAYVAYDVYKVPNPFSKYWEMKDKIK